MKDNYSEILESYLIPAEEGSLKELGKDLWKNASIPNKIGIVALPTALAFKAGTEIVGGINKYRNKKATSNHPTRNSRVDQNILNNNKNEEKKTKINYQEYYKYLNEVYSKIPSEVINREKALRKKEFIAIQNFLHKLDIKYKNIIGINFGIDPNGEIQDFLKCSSSDIFETFYSIQVMSFNGYDFMKNHYPEVSSGYVTDKDNKFYEILDSKFMPISDNTESEFNKFLSIKNIRCYKDPENDWDKYEGVLVIHCYPSKEFMEAAKQYGYLSQDVWGK